MGYGDTFGFFLYQSDNGASYEIKLSLLTAAEGGFSAATGGPLGGVNPVWPWHASDMRHVTGVSASGKRARLPIAIPDDARYQIGGTFTLHGVAYTITGAEGERRVANHVQ